MISITDTTYFAEYKKNSNISIRTLWKQFAELPTYPSVSFARQSAAVFSSRIEGVDIDLNFYLNSRLINAKGISAETRQTLEWVQALEDTYSFAERHDLNERNFLKAHFMASIFMDNPQERGTYRRVPVVIGSRVQIVYRPLPPEAVAPAMERFWADMKILLASKLSPEQALYHASLLHLVFEKIHPFTDGNGRVGRLLEKWFLARQCGKIAWKIASESYYEQHRARYYANLKVVGESPATLNFAHSLPFLRMLPEAIEQEIRDLV
jgi:Fic family protein